MLIGEMASLLCKREGKKSQVKVGDMREILACLVQLEAEAVGAGDRFPPSRVIAERAKRLNKPQRSKK